MISRSCVSGDAAGGHTLAAQQPPTLVLRCASRSSSVKPHHQPAPRRRARSVRPYLRGQAQAWPVTIAKLRVPASEQVCRTDHAQARLVQHMGVDHRRGDVGVAQQLLDGADVLSAFQEMRGE